MNEGRSKIRILTSKENIVTYYTVFSDGPKDGTKKGNSKTAYPNVEGFIPPSDAKMNWGVIVWNYDVNALQIWEISQKSIRNQLLELGEVRAEFNTFDLFIKRDGSTKETTKYSLTPADSSEMPAELKQEIAKQYKELGPDLEKLTEGLNPFNKN